MSSSKKKDAIASSTAEKAILPASLPAHKYYPTVAFAALTKVLRDNSLSTHHKKAVEAMLLICTAHLGARRRSTFPKLSHLSFGLPNTAAGKKNQQRLSGFPPQRDGKAV